MFVFFYVLGLSYRALINVQTEKLLRRKCSYQSFELVLTVFLPFYFVGICSSMSNNYKNNNKNDISFFVYIKIEISGGSRAPRSLGILDLSIFLFCYPL